LSHNLPEEDDDDDDENSLSGSPSSCLKYLLRLLCHRKLLWLVCSTLSISCMHDKEEVLHFFFFFFFLKVLSSEDSWPCSFGGRANVSATAEEFCVFVRFESHRGGRRRTTNPAHKDGESVEIVLWNSGNRHGTVRRSLLCSFPSSYATAAASNYPR
jgi:hypothetical protein